MKVMLSQLVNAGVASLAATGDKEVMVDLKSGYVTTGESIDIIGMGDEGEKATGVTVFKIDIEKTP